MLFKKLLDHYMKNNPDVKKIGRQLEKLEAEMHQLIELQKKQPSEPTSPTIIEKINVEKIFVDRIEHNNNFGALGIKSLEGRLNIGANYGLGNVPSEADKKQKEKAEKSASAYRRANRENAAPVYHIHPKKQ